MKWPDDNLNSQELKNIRNGKYGESYKILYEYFSNFFSNMLKYTIVKSNNCCTTIS